MSFQGLFSNITWCPETRRLCKFCGNQKQEIIFMFFDEEYDGEGVMLMNRVRTKRFPIWEYFYGKTVGLLMEIVFVNYIFGTLWWSVERLHFKLVGKVFNELHSNVRKIVKLSRSQLLPAIVKKDSPALSICLSFQVNWLKCPLLWILVVLKT